MLYPPGKRGSLRCTRCGSAAHRTYQHAKACTLCGSGSHVTAFHAAQIEAQAFETYFNLAEELDGGLTLDDLDEDFVAQGRRYAEAEGLSWPPVLAEAEELWLDRRAGR